MNVARLAGLPEACVQRAIAMSDKFEASLQSVTSAVRAVEGYAQSGNVAKLRAMAKM
jgi:hypothetical protein